MTNDPPITLEDDIDACEGDQMLGIFMHKLFTWADSTNAGLTKIKGTRWIGCSTNRWITERRPWGKKHKVSRHQFERMLARGRKTCVLETCQWPSRFEKGDKQWKTVLHVRPADGYIARRTSAARRRTDAGSTRGFCEANAGPVQNRDQDHGTLSRTGSEAVIGVPAKADNAITPSACVPGEEHEAIASSGGSRPLPPVPPPPSPRAETPNQLWKVWAEQCFQHHGLRFEQATLKQKGQLRALQDIARGRGLDPIAFVTTVVADWSWLTGCVRERTSDVLYVPNEPCLGFTRRFLDHLILAVEEEAARKVEEARRDAERKAKHKADREREEAECTAARVARERVEREELDTMARQGAQFETKEAAVASMYACIGGGKAPQLISSKSIRAFLSSWGGDEQLNDEAIHEKYRPDLGQGYFASAEL